MPGSSPRVRGKRPVVPPRTFRRGLIPARAGKTLPQRPSWPWAWAHPRACGENCVCPARPASGRGSSPRVRGKHQRSDAGSRIPGLIPARAGKTTMPGRPRSASTAHPRACGENMTTTLLLQLLLGSSPRVRGKPTRPRIWCSEERLIPARAGKTKPAPVNSSSTGAHPRACGENLDADKEAVRQFGSSPRVRGKRHF